MTAAAPRARAPALDDMTLRRAQRGDDRAWRTLVECYAPAIHGLVWRLFAGRARHRVPDLVQETFVRVLSALPSFDPAGPAALSTWILTIATRLALNELRRPEQSTLVDEPAASDEAPDTTVARRRLAAAIASGVAELPDPQRAVLVLREYHDLDYAEIAEVLELDVGTVKSRLSRARAALRSYLERRHV